MPVIATLLIAGVLAAGPGPTAAPTVTVRVELDAPSGCADTQAFSDALSERSQSIRWAKPGEPATLLRVHLTRAGNQVRGELSVVDAEGATDTRRVEGSSCDEVVRGLSLTASLALDRMLPPRTEASANPDGHGANGGDGSDSSAGKDASDKQTADANKPALNAAKGAPAAPPDERGADSKPLHGNQALASVPYFVDLGVAAVVSELVSPAWSSGAGVALRVHRGQAGPTLGLSLLYTSNDALSSASDLVVTWVGAALTVCPLRVSLATSLWLEPCALAEGGRVRVSDRLVLRGRSVDRSWWSAGALARGGLELGAHIQLALELGLSAPLRERRFVLDNPEESVGHSPALSPLFALGASYGF